MGDLGADYQLDPSMPAELKTTLYERLLRIANHGNRSDKAMAMNRLGTFFLKAFGTVKSFNEAFTWFCRAAEHGSVEAKKMVFRMERATEDAPKKLHADLTAEIRSNWMLDCLLDTIKYGYDPRLSPNSIDFGSIHARLRDTLTSVEPYIRQRGISKDFEANIIRMACVYPTSELSLRTLKVLQNEAQNSPLLKSLIDKVYYDDSDSLGSLLSQRTAQTENFKDRLVPLAADYGRMKALRTLITEYGANPDYIDTQSGRTNVSVIYAVMRNDYRTLTTLADCGATLTGLMSRTVMDYAIRTGYPAIMRFCLEVLQHTEFDIENKDLCGSSSMCHQFLDGICPAMDAMWKETDAIPPDVSGFPPLFEAIMYNRLDTSWAILAKGASPHVRSQGMSAVHLAVRLLRPTALLLLLAFGADPNSRNSKVGYTTPLHTLSEHRLTFPVDTPGLGLEGRDFLLRSYKPHPEDGDELNHRRAIIIKILLDYGADPKLHCIDGFTPLMTAMVSPVQYSKNVFNQLLDAGVSLEDRSSRNETMLHICVLAKDTAWLRRVLSSGGTRFINSKDISCSTPLFLAARYGDTDDMVKLLLEHGADAKERGILELSVLDVAFIEGRKNTIWTLLNHIENLPVSDRSKSLGETDCYGRCSFHTCLALADTDLASKCLDRLLQLVGPLSYTLLAARDEFGYTAIDYAQLRNNKTAVNKIESLTHKVDGPPNICHPSSRQTQGKFPNTGNPMTSFTEYHSIIDNIARGKDEDKTKYHDCCEFTGPNKLIRPVETEYEVRLEEWRQQYGDENPKVVWCMNNLGTVYERYGRLQKAQDIHYRGWKKARKVFGDKSLVTKDFACKYLRVVSDRGLQGTEDPDVTEFQRFHGENTLKNNGMVIVQQSDLISGKAEEYRSYWEARMGQQNMKPRDCDRFGCNKPSKLVCSGKHFL